MIACIFNFLNTNSGAIIGIATVVLVGITSFYVWCTFKLSNTTSKQFKLQREQYLFENRPWIYIYSFYPYQNSLYDFVCNLSNCGKFPALINDFEASLFHNDNLIEKKTQILCQYYPLYPGESVESIIIRYNEKDKINHALSPTVSDGKPLIIKINITYYSLTDKEKRKEYPFNITYGIYKAFDRPKIIEYYAE